MQLTRAIPRGQSCWVTMLRKRKRIHDVIVHIVAALARTGVARAYLLKNEIQLTDYNCRN
jgi:hypothetical protein